MSVEGGGAASEGVAADKHPVAGEGTLELAAAGGALLGFEFGGAGLGIPIGDEGAVGRSGNGVLEDGGLRCEEARDEVYVVARCGDDDAAVAQVDAVEFCAVDVNVVHCFLVGIHQDEVAGFEHFDGRMVESICNGLG